MPVHEHRVDSEKGSGSRSEMGDEMVGSEWKSKDKRANTKTTFYESDIDRLNVSRRRKWRLKRAQRHNEGENVNSDNEQSRGQQNYEETKRRLVSTISSQLSLTPAQKDRVSHLVMDVLNVNSYGNYSVEEVILGAITYVCMEDMGASGVHIDDRNDFHRIVKDVGTTMQRVKRARKLTRDKLG